MNLKLPPGATPGGILTWIDRPSAVSTTMIEPAGAPGGHSTCITDRKSVV